MMTYSARQILRVEELKPTRLLIRGELISLYRTFEPLQVVVVRFTRVAIPFMAGLKLADSRRTVKLMSFC